MQIVSRPCTKCGETKPLDDFYLKTKATATRKAYYFAQCKKCYLSSRHLYNDDWREKHRADIAKKQRESYVSRPRQRHPEYKVAAKARWRERNRERLRENSRNYYRRNPSRIQAAVNKRRAIIRNCEGSFTAQEWNDLKEQYGRCLCCGATDVPLSPDHIVPLSRGGSNGIENIQPLCLPCNLRKQTKTIDYR